ncbi:hypothetical protein ES288_A10G000700v1 [Gossypium darwinii]|uniref:Lysophospholipid acyltransferase 1-like n=1 Tax=Gossypium darwinii TaxID=34276 RepID=A0A5D2EVJ3_GOSDA|nr:hypothetical protein ES288_A10G000700v1 [Gossypium darwinii]
MVFRASRDATQNTRLNFEAKHLYSAFTGALLSYLSFGFSSNLHFLVPMLLGYVAMVLYRPNHVYYMSGDAWKQGGIDATGALMVLTLKVISCAMNYNDGLLKEEDLREAQKKNRLIKLPSLIEYFGYCLCCGSHFAGPVYEMKNYLDWTEGKGYQDATLAHSDKGPSPSPYVATLRVLVQAAFCMAMFLYLSPSRPLSWFTDPAYQEWGFWRKLSYQYMSGFTMRWKYYFIWSISEAAMVISGLGFTKVVDILGFELAKSSVLLPLVLNIQVSTWLLLLKYAVGEKKPGFFQLLGLYPGYIILFVQSALMIAGSRVIYQWEKAIPTNMALVKKAFAVMNFAYTVLVLNYSCVGFMLLSKHETLASYGSVYYIGTMIPIALIILGYIIPAKPASFKARKEQ